MDVYTLFPEMMNNDIRDGRTTNRMNDSQNPDKSVASPNYWFPTGYIEGVEVPENAVFLFQSQHNTYWSYEGDEFMLTSDANDIDITLQLPKLPDGEYQLRLGVCTMPNRPIVQSYFDGEAYGIPLDLRTVQEGWYAGPASAFCMMGEGYPDGTNTDKRYYFNIIQRMTRAVVGTFHFREGEQHTLRLRDVAGMGGILQLDYLEFVPKSVYEGDEDNY